MKKKWDLIVIGGGIAGVAAAISAGRQDCKVLLIEKNGFLGGCATASLVTPMMNNKPTNSKLYEEILKKLEETGDAATHSDGNPGWFNPEEMKFLLDELCEESGVDVLFETYLASTKVEVDRVVSVNCLNKAGFQDYKADFFIDATGDADLAFQAGVPVDTEGNQALSLRFTMDNVDIYRFADWLTDIEPEMELSSVEYVKEGIALLTTAHTAENFGWKLRPYFNLAVKDGILQKEDTEYFQLFTIPGQKNAVTFNCPRIYSNKPLNPLDPWDVSYAYMQGRKQIKRLENFCKEYLQGFEDAYISQIAPMLGIRESRRIEGVYKLTREDVLKGKKFENKAASSNYPIDIHGTPMQKGFSDLDKSQESAESIISENKNTNLLPIYYKNKSENKLIELSKDNYYNIPAESLMPKDLINLMVVGKCLSATFEAQASARIMPNCIATGEYAGNCLAERIKKCQITS